jgi:hypothetical protein
LPNLPSARFRTEPPENVTSVLASLRRCETTECQVPEREFRRARLVVQRFLRQLAGEVHAAAGFRRDQAFGSAGVLQAAERQDGQHEDVRRFHGAHDTAAR